MADKFIIHRSANLRKFSGMSVIMSNVDINVDYITESFPVPAVAVSTFDT